MRQCIFVSAQNTHCFRMPHVQLAHGRGGDQHTGELCDRHVLFYGSRVAMPRTPTAYCAELRLNLASKGEAVLNLCPIFFRSRRWALWSIATRIQTHFRRAHVSHVVRTDRVSPALVVIFAPMQPERVPVI